jgi:hypothetical protein
LPVASQTAEPPDRRSSYFRRFGMRKAGYAAVFFALLMLSGFETALASIIGLQNPGPDQWQFVKLDPSTGKVTPLGSVMSGFSLTGGCAFDSLSGRYYVSTANGNPLGPAPVNPGITVIDSKTGTLLKTINVAVYGIAANAGTIFGLQNPGPDQWQFVKLDPSTGNVTPLGSVVSGFSLTGSCAFDSLSGRYYVSTANGNPLGPAPVNPGITVIDSKTGTLLKTINVAVYDIAATPSSTPRLGSFKKNKVVGCF